MLADCQEWRRTVEGVGIDELCGKIDPFDVSYMSQVAPQGMLMLTPSKVSGTPHCF
jgi:hypothetical protein